MGGLIDLQNHPSSIDKQKARNRMPFDLCNIQKLEEEEEEEEEEDWGLLKWCFIISISFDVVD